MIGDSPDHIRYLFQNLVINDEYRLRTLDPKQIKFIADIGGNLGMFSLFARMLFPASKITAFEPNPVSQDHFDQNLSSFGVTLVRVALGDGSDFKMVVPGRTTGNTQFRPGKDREGINARSFTFADILKVSGINEITGKYAVVKVDTEGAERYMLEESPALLRSIHHLAMEVHFGPTFGNPGSDVFKDWADKTFEKTHDISWIGKYQGVDHGTAMLIVHRRPSELP